MQGKTREEARREAYEREVQSTIELRRAMVGRWGEVLPRIISGIEEAVSKRGKGHIQCPISTHTSAQGKKKPDPKFRICDKKFYDEGRCWCTCRNDLMDGFQVVMAAKRCDFKEAKDMIMDALGGRRFASSAPKLEYTQQSPEDVAAEDEKARAYLRKTWAEAFDLDAPEAVPVRNWFHARGLTSVDGVQSVRMHPGLRYFDAESKKDLGRFPAMVSVVQDIDCRPVTLHRTYLSKDGSKKAPVPTERKVASYASDRVLTGAAIRLDSFTFPVLAVGEGVESSLSAREMVSPMGIPTWSTVNANGMRHLALPDWAEILVVFADRDRSNAGQHAAYELVERARSEGRRAVALLPQYVIPEGKKSIDWNDVVMQIGVAAAQRLLPFLQCQRKIRSLLREREASTGTQRARVSA